MKKLIFLALFFATATCTFADQKKKVTIQAYPNEGLRNGWFERTFLGRDAITFGQVYLDKKQGDSNNEVWVCNCSGTDNCRAKTISGILLESKKSGEKIEIPGEVIDKQRDEMNKEVFDLIVDKEELSGSKSFNFEYSGQKIIHVVSWRQLEIDAPIDIIYTIDLLENIIEQ